MKKAFSLVEIIIIIMLLGIVFPASLFIYGKYLKSTRDVKRKSDLQNIAKALEEFYFDKNYYPTMLSDCGSNFAVGESVLMSSIPCDPVTGVDYYFESCNQTNTWYRLYANLEESGDADIDEAGCRYGCGPDCNYNYGVASSNINLATCGTKYVCAPGGGRSGSCEIYEFPERSLCPKIYYNDPSCSNECGNPDNRCQNASGKQGSEQKDEDNLCN